MREKLAKRDEEHDFELKSIRSQLLFHQNKAIDLENTNRRLESKISLLKQQVNLPPPTTKPTEKNHEKDEILRSCQSEINRISNEKSSIESKYTRIQREYKELSIEKEFFEKQYNASLNDSEILYKSKEETEKKLQALESEISSLRMRKPVIEKVDNSHFQEISLLKSEILILQEEKDRHLELNAEVLLFC